MDENERLYNSAVMLWGQSNGGENIELVQQARDALEKIDDGYRADDVRNFLNTINNAIGNYHGMD